MSEIAFPSPKCTATVGVSKALSYELIARDTAAKTQMFCVQNKYAHIQYVPMYIFKHISTTLQTIFYDLLQL